jgi:hypothetical protein
MLNQGEAPVAPGADTARTSPHTALSPSGSALLTDLQAALTRVGIPYEDLVRSFGQVEAAELRAAGKRFSVGEHLRGLILSKLSSNRPWGGVARNLDRIRDIFFGYDPEAVRQADPGILEQQLRAIQCGNRRIRSQMLALRPNIETFYRIEAEHGSLDRFVTSSDPYSVASQLADAASPYKLRMIGLPLALEYLRNVGIAAAKPDVHVRRALSGERLAYSAALPSPREAHNIMDRLAAEARTNATYLDNLLWLFCAADYGDICNARPRCGICPFREVCNFPKTGNPTSRRMNREDE